MVNDHSEQGTRIIDRGVFEHLQIAVAVAETGDGAASDTLVNPDRLARSVVDEEVMHLF